MVRIVWVTLMVAGLLTGCGNKVGVTHPDGKELYSYPAVEVEVENEVEATELMMQKFELSETEEEPKEEEKPKEEEAAQDE